MGMWDPCQYEGRLVADHPVRLADPERRGPVDAPQGPPVGHPEAHFGEPYVSMLVIAMAMMCVLKFHARLNQQMKTTPLGGWPSGSTAWSHQEAHLEDPNVPAKIVQ